MDTDPTVVAFTDGGCRGNPGIGGWGFILIHLPTGRALERRGGEPHTTNNRMEITAALEALRSLTSDDVAIEIRSDSRYLVNLASQWLHGWKQKGWKKKGGPIKNLDLIKDLDTLQNRHRVTWTWVQAHAGIPGNEHADTLTNKAMDRITAGRDPAHTKRYPSSPVRT